MKWYDEVAKNKCEGWSLRNSILVRLPGGMMLHSLNPKTWNWGYGLRVSCLCIVHHFGAFFFGDRHTRKKSIMRLKENYPVLYHLSPAVNTKNIMEEGLVVERGRIWLTDWRDPCWQKNLKKHQGSDDIVCFKIDTSKLIDLGHQVDVMNSFHEYTTDYIPPECILFVKRMHRKNK